MVGVAQSSVQLLRKDTRGWKLASETMQLLLGIFLPLLASISEYATAAGNLQDPQYVEVVRPDVAAPWRGGDTSLRRSAVPDGIIPMGAYTGALYPVGSPVQGENPLQDLPPIRSQLRQSDRELKIVLFLGATVALFLLFYYLKQRKKVRLTFLS